MRTKTKSKAVRDARYARTFGLEAAAVRLGPCVAMRNFDGPDKRIRCRVNVKTIDDEQVLVWDPAHVQSVGAGGTRMDLVRLCSAHHGQQHDIGIESFGELYGLDLRALADEQALAHEPPLGIRGLAAGWSLHEAGLQAFGPSGYDLAALMAWTLRRMETEMEAKRKRDAYAVACEPKWHPFPMERGTLANAVALDLGGQFVDHPLETPGSDGDLAWTLCEQAGWPS